jgi:hypothetical protein
MILAPKSFPKLQFFLIFSLVSFISCREQVSPTIDNEKFIEIYARLLIIYEMEVSKEFHDRLIDELFHDYNTSADKIDSTLVSLNNNPEQWVSILERVRKRIQEIRKDFAPDENMSERDINKGRPALINPVRRSRKMDSSNTNQKDIKKSEKFKFKSKEIDRRK